MLGQAIVAIVLPPNAGRVINNWFATPLNSPISSTVQSAVKPVLTLADTRGPKSLPLAVAKPAAHLTMLRMHGASHLSLE